MAKTVVIFCFFRYSYFHKLIPLLLTGLSDDIEEIRTKSSELFEKVLNISPALPL